MLHPQHIILSSHLIHILFLPTKSISLNKNIRTVGQWQH